jgi:hypothetical protein
VTEKKNILIQLDTDSLPSVFDRVVAFDAGADQVLSYGGVTPDAVRDLVHGAIFTRGPRDLRHTALFVGGSDLGAGERLLREIREAFLGRLRVSVMLDSSGANTTAAAAVCAVRDTLELRPDTTAVVLGATGAVGQRVALLLAASGVRVRVGSRDRARAAEVCARLEERGRAGAVTGSFEAVATAAEGELAAALAGASVVVSAGAAGRTLLPASAYRGSSAVRVLVDLNAVPPAGIEGVEAADRNQTRHGVQCFGALGVGGVKMKLHKAGVAALFESNDQVLDAESLLDLGGQLSAD